VASIRAVQEIVAIRPESHCPMRSDTDEDSTRCQQGHQKLLSCGAPTKLTPIGLDGERFRRLRLTVLANNGDIFCDGNDLRRPFGRFQTEGGVAGYYTVIHRS